jgi:hypothetical protein
MVGVIRRAWLPLSQFTPANILAKLLTVDGSGSGLDADTVDGQHASAFQPVDSDLTAIAALTTTSFGRGLLELANAAAARTKIGYEEGTFTPTISASSGTFDSVSGSGRYIKFGKLVAWRVIVVITTVGTAAGQLRTTLPFTAVVATWPQTGINASTGAGLTGNASTPSTTQAFFLTAAGGSPIAANTLVIGGVYEAAS